MICLKDVSRTRQLLNVQVQMRISTFHNIASRLQHHDFCPRSWKQYSTCCFPSGEPRCRPGAVRIMFWRKEVLRTCQLRQPGCTGSSVLLLASAAPPAAGSSLLLTVALTCKPNESAGLLARGVRQKGLSWVYMPPDMQTPMPGSRSSVLGFNATRYADANARVKKFCPGFQCLPKCRRQQRQVQKSMKAGASHRCTHAAIRSSASSYNGACKLTQDTALRRRAKRGMFG